MTEPTKALTPQDVAKTVADVKSFDPGLGSYSFTDLGAVVKFSDLMSKAGEMLPEHLRQKPALCMAVTMRATHWGFDPFALAMETYQAKQGGPIGYQAKVFTAALRNAGVKLKYRYEGSLTILDEPVMSARGNKIADRKATGDRKCIAYASVDGEVLEYETMTLDQITIKNSPMWHNDPDQQLAYMAGRGWARRYRSDVIMGAYTTEEVEQMPAMKDVTPEPSKFAQKAMEARKAAAEDPVEAEEVAPDFDQTDAAEEIRQQAAADHAQGKERDDCPYDEGTPSAQVWLETWDHMEAAV